MAGSDLRSGLDYHVLFNPKDYLNTYYAGPTAHDLSRFALGPLHEIYSTGQVQGKRIIDIGSGPTIHMLIPVTKWFDELYISDFSKGNIEIQKKWLAKDPQAYDWQHYFRYFAEKDGNENDWRKYDELLRNKVKGILACDVHNCNPLHPECMPKFDAVTTSLALEAACKDLDQFRKAVKNITSLLAPGGYIIIFSVLKKSLYAVGDEKFWALWLTADEVQESLKEAGLEVVRCFEKRSKQDDVICTYDGLVITLARKQT